MGTSPFPTQFTFPLPCANDGVHERLAKLEARMLGAEAGGGGGVTAASLAPFSGIVFSPPLPGGPFEPIASLTPDVIAILATQGGPFEPSANKSNASIAADSAVLFPTQHGAKIYADGKLSLGGGTLSNDLDISTGIHLDADGSASFGVGNALFSTVGDLSFSGTLHAGVVLNNLTTAQRNAIGAPTEGMLVMNTDTDVPNFYNGASWVSLGTGAGDALTANPLSQFAATTSAQLAGVISDEVGTGALVFKSYVDTAVAGVTPPFVDTTPLVKGSADATKLLRFEVDGFTTATTRTLTPQNASYTLAGLETAQTFVAKQTITPPADTTALQVTGFSLTGATTAPMLDLAGTWNTSGVTTALLLNITNTASGADSKLLDLQLGGTSFLSLSKTAVVRLGDGTAPAGDPTAAIQQWSAGGEWQYRAATASEGAGQTNRAHNRAESSFGSGTGYTLTTSLARIVFGTTSMALNLPSAGTYLIRGQLVILADPIATSDACVFQFFNDTDSSFIASGIAQSQFSGQYFSTLQMDLITITSPKTIHIYGVNFTAARGVVQAVYSHMGYTRLY